jgi:acetyl esterase
MTTFHSLDLLVDDIDPAALAVQQQLNAMIAQEPHPDVRTPEGLAVFRAGTAHNPGVTVLEPRDLEIDGPDGALRLRIFTPETPRAVVYRIHGGGWAAGAPEDDDVYNDKLARAAQVVIVSPDYGLAPDVRVRDQVGQVVAGARWLAANAAAEFGVDRLLIGGISAGGHLAAATVLALQRPENPEPVSFIGALLDCGVYDLRLSPSVAAATEETLILTRSWLDGLMELGFPELQAAYLRDPVLSPIYGDLTAFPPTLLTVGQLDPLCDDSIILAARLRLAGRDAAVDVWPEAPHAFTSFPWALAELALARTVSWINDLLVDGQR